MKKRSGVIQSILGPETDIRGVLRSEHSVQIEGYFDGEIFVKNDVYIAENSTVKATIHAHRVIVSGEVIGDIEALHTVTVNKTGRVYGNISGNELHVEPGGLYKGNVNMDVVSHYNDYEGMSKFAR
ncbi:MAG: polymer-forming cytoskeletal protein [Candidatus Marinamargulisbacteria bacterium]|jgi:cytoskeletal protein CcmA (bactofilin family)|nr:polymer-forming cytoskeletal protein [Candidatus Marinamargulisbacteria bacterium]